MDSSFDFDLDSEAVSGFVSDIKMEPSTSSSSGQPPPRLHSEEDVFRSMKIKDTSTTPYSDATQVGALHTYIPT